MSSCGNYYRLIKKIDNLKSALWSSSGPPKAEGGPIGFPMGGTDGTGSPGGMGGLGRPQRRIEIVTSYIAFPFNILIEIMEFECRYLFEMLEKLYS